MDTLAQLFVVVCTEFSWIRPSTREHDKEDGKEDWAGEIDRRMEGEGVGWKLTARQRENALNRVPLNLVCIKGTGPQRHPTKHAKRIEM